ncbi:molybdopterin molybdotransferase MoeA [Pelagimonas varians]|uniref:Molybdopterin molybdenumtransferase n=1 Tax=Pelagimonas varians TaxID=696760 RepID=A0A238L658_9RHOB|nr:gephyrin-like molybdotransferase Glp [Pelagimonas varians]PYG25453.1 molybdopterin molybdotransferase [Pelagimonas varians]SMX50477.1 Molybdopterin molybdenumtransferase [Pelagimonas varians]
MHIDRVTPGCGCDSVLPPADMMSVADALDRALALVAPLADTLSLRLFDSFGRTVANTVHAAEAMPFFDNSAMDGFALRCDDLACLGALPIAGTVAAGESPRALPEGAALHIFTGAPLPQGADAVVMVECAVEKQGHVSFTTKPEVGDNIRHAGSDQAAGQELLVAGARIEAHHIGLLAANGIETVEVVRRPRIAVFSTGDELASGKRKLGQIPDANRPMLIALAQVAGADVDDLGILSDDLEATVAALKNLGAQYDLILTSGAVSMGGKDHIREALVAAGGDVQGWRVALKPGKPVMFGKLGGAAFTGLPGNPFAVHVGFHMYVLPQIARLLGAVPAPFAPVPAVAGFNWTRKAGRAEVFPVRLVRYDSTGMPVLERLGRSVSATLLPLGQADGLAIVPADCGEISTGAPLSWRPFCIIGEDP